jgi:hypothetical protein
MTHTYTKSFIKLWVSQMVTNNAFIQDDRINSNNIGLASAGNLLSLREILNVYADYIDQPIPQQAINIAPQAPEHKQREMHSVLPPSQRRQSINEFLALIESNSIEIIE